MVMLSFYSHCYFQFDDILLRTFLFLLVTEIGLSFSCFVISLSGFGRSFTSFIKQVRSVPYFPFLWNS